MLELSVSGIASRYAFGGEDMLAELSQLLFDALFDPLLDGEGEFPQEGFQQEKRQLLELKDAEYNDKMVYARRRCEELLFQGQRAGIDRCGSREAVQNLRREGLYQAWRQTLENARIEIFALGDCQPEASAFRQRFQGMGQPRLLGKAPYREPKEVLRVTEEQPVSQGKLSLAYRVDAAPQERMLFQLVNAVLGGTVNSSKLFLNVREKMSLCYYCSSAFSWASGALFIDSGVEPDNMDRAEEAIQAQLDAICQGDVTEEELLPRQAGHEELPALRGRFPPRGGELVPVPCLRPPHPEPGGRRGPSDQLHGRRRGPGRPAAEARRVLPLERRCRLRWNCKKFPAAR